MKIRQRKALVMEQIKRKNKYVWFVAPFLKRFHELKAKNEQRAALIARSMP